VHALGGWGGGVPPPPPPPPGFTVFVNVRAEQEAVSSAQWEEQCGLRLAPAGSASLWFQKEGRQTVVVITVCVSVTTTECYVIVECIGVVNTA